MSALIVHGQAFDSGSSQIPAKKLALSLFQRNSTSLLLIDDTLVMANYGYYQLRVPQPSLYFLKVETSQAAPFSLPPSVKNATLMLMVHTWDGLYKKLDLIRVASIPENISEVTEINDSNFMTRFFKSWTETKGSSGSSDEIIHVFSVASGHLYEQLLWVAIQSILKHASRPVKFWFLSEFLSPRFLQEQLPYLSIVFKFTYECVRYTWPPWLRGQQEKQRIIWAYKILFLDVLFPLSLKRIIFIDADQIVRTDLWELMTLNLQGHVYAFTPMGSSNPDTEGYRFWKTGYWKELLGDDRQYHISALFVVDLIAFRKFGAGDLLRYHYQQLSVDSANLANLDQDLPNNLQDYLPIFSLPQEWLWCETWCSMADLPMAKTIDLCNHPMTKEHKLKKAKRLIPEWTIYHDNLQKILGKLQEFNLVEKNSVLEEKDKEPVLDDEGRKFQSNTVLDAWKMYYREHLDL